MEEKKQSPADELKEKSRYLRGTIAESLKSDSTHFSADEIQLLKFHGSYQQDDRDLRQALMREKKEKAFSMMVRSKLPGGKLTASQYLAHDELARKYGNQTMRITDRQGIQFHGVLKKNLKALILELNQKLVTTSGACGDIVRNVMASTTPLKERKNYDLFEYAKAVSDQFLAKSNAYYDLWLDGEKVETHQPTENEAEPIYGKTYLPRKFKIGICYPEDNSVDVYTQDLGIVASTDEKGELNGFNILVGGGMGMTHGVAKTRPILAKPFCFVSSKEDLLAVSKAIVLVQRDFGNREDRKQARMKYLIEERGLDWFRSEVEKRYGKPTEPVRDINIQEVETYQGWREQSDGRWLLGLFIENGRVKDADGFRLMSGLRAVVEKYKCDVYLTGYQDALLAGFEEGQKTEVESLLREYGIKLPEEYSVLRRHSIACPAYPTCALAIAESERAMPDVMTAFDQTMQELGLQDQPIISRMTGCPNGCARPYNAEIAFVGRTPGTYNIYVGGNHRGDRLAEELADKVKQEDLPKVLKPILSLYKQERKDSEGFGTFCERSGIEKLRALVPADVG